MEKYATSLLYNFWVVLIFYFTYLGKFVRCVTNPPPQKKQKTQKNHDVNLVPASNSWKLYNVILFFLIFLCAITSFPCLSKPFLGLCNLFISLLRFWDWSIANIIIGRRTVGTLPRKTPSKHKNTKSEKERKGGGCRVSGIRMNWESLINPKIRGKKIKL